jgi:hypothetical protein
VQQLTFRSPALGLWLTVLWPDLFSNESMEKNLILSVQSLNEVWELPDDLVLKLEEYKTEHPLSPDNSNADEIHQAWFATLTPEQQAKVGREKKDEATG